MPGTRIPRLANSGPSTLYKASTSQTGLSPRIHQSLALSILVQPSQPLFEGHLDVPTVIDVLSNALLVTSSRVSLAAWELLCDSYVGHQLPGQVGHFTGMDT